MRKENPGKEVIAPIELGVSDWKDIATRILTRPIRMVFSESLVLFSCLYLALAYAVFYLSFETYPVIFQGKQRLYDVASNLRLVVANEFDSCQPFLCLTAFCFLLCESVEFAKKHL